MSPIPGVPRESPKPQPIGNIPLIFLFTTCTLCAIFLLWRRVETLRRVVSLQLKTFRGSEGRIRLSEDDGPPANEFLDDDYDEDNEHIDDSDDQPLSEHVRKVTQAWREPNILENDTHDDNIEVLPISHTSP